MILNIDMEDNKRKGKRGKYGTVYERMTSPGRQYMREYISTPAATKINNKA